MTKTPWREVFRDLWRMYLCVCRECFSMTGTPREIFEARICLLVLHTAGILMLMWWMILGYWVVAVVRMVVA